MDSISSRTMSYLHPEVSLAYLNIAFVQIVVTLEEGRVDVSLIVKPWYNCT